MSPPVISNIRCYLYRDFGSKLWTAITADVPNCKVTCLQPEDSVKRIQTLVLEQLSQTLMYRDISTNLQINIIVEVVSEEEAWRLTSNPDFGLGYETSP